MAETDAPLQPTVDLTFAQDGGLTKQVLQSGHGPTPQWGARVTFHYTAYLMPENEKFESTKDNLIPYTVTIDEQCKLIRGLLLGIQTMQRGEWAVLHCTPEYGYGEKGRPPTIPPNKHLKFEVQMMQIANPDPPLEKPPKELTPSEKFSISILAKEQGNRLFKEQKYEEAIDQYRKAKGSITWTYRFTDAEKARWNQEMGVPIQLNLALAYLKLNKFQDCIDYCFDVIDLDPENQKAFYRRAQAYLGMEEYEKALKDMTRAYELSNEDPAVKRELDKMKRKETESIRNQQQKWNKLFTSAETADYLKKKQSE